MRRSGSLKSAGVLCLENSRSYQKRLGVYALLALFAAMLLLSGCGGGTTGTSSTGELKLLGVSQSASGRPLIDAPMSVFSATSDEELLSAQTDSRGDFEMSLPPEESALVVELEGRRTSPLVRAYSGSSVLSTVLYEGAQGDVGFQSSLEAKVDDARLCSSLQAADNRLVVIGEIGVSPCTVAIEISAVGLDTTTVQGEVRSVCGGISRVTDSAVASVEGVLLLDVAPSFQLGCESAELAIFTRGSRLKSIVIPIE
jgi:hypothetical protein